MEEHHISHFVSPLEQDMAGYPMGQQQHHLLAAAFRQHEVPQPAMNQAHHHTIQPPLQPASQPPAQPQLSSPVHISSLAQGDQTDRARAYKSRNKRPCDFCRYKKAACHLENQPPCELCLRYNKECTFVESPAKRRRPNAPNTITGSDIPGNRKQSTNEPYASDATSNGVHGVPEHHQFIPGPVDTSLNMQQDMLGWDNGLPQFNVHAMPLSPAIQPNYPSYEPNLYHDHTSHVHFNTFNPSSAASTTLETATNSNSNQHLGNGNKQQTPRQYHSSIEPSPSSQPTPALVNLNLPFNSTSAEPSLDNQASSNSLFVGMSGETDPYLMTRFRFDQYNETHFQSIRIRKLAPGGVRESSIPVFFNISHNGLASKAQPPREDEALERYRKEVDEMVGPDVGRRLIRLFYKYIQPYFPVLSCERRDERDLDGMPDPSTAPTCVLAAIYGHTLRFCPWDEELCVDVYTPPSTDALFKIAWQACTPLLHTPCLAVLQTLLLLVQRRPTNKHVSDTPFKWTMMTTAVSIAQALGIDRDPTDWPIPRWEVRLRKRLAWATFVQDKWIALNFGRSSHIQADDWDVPPLTKGDFAESAWHNESSGAPPLTYCNHFIKLCELTVIVDRTMHDLFSIRATKALHNKLEMTLEIAKALRLQLTEWHHSLPPGLFPHAPEQQPDNKRNRNVKYDLDGNGSLQLAYITAKIELFRAMFRPRVVDANATAVSALRAGALAVAKEMVDFLEGLNAKELEAFWASYSRTNFTIASSFMLLLFVTSPDLPDATECLNLLDSWRSLLRVQSRSCDLLNLALLRLDGAYVQGFDRLIDLSPAAAQAWSEQAK